MGNMSINPDDLKYGLECCIKYMACVPAEECCDVCPYQGRCGTLEKDAVSLIRQLEAEKAELKRELGSAVMALATCAMDGLDGNICNYCTRKNCDEQDLHYECFEWRSPCEENGGK